MHIASNGSEVNQKSLDAIADDIHKLERGNIVDIGGLLIEAKGQCEHGQWLDWLSTEFEWSWDTADRYMKVKKLGDRFRSVRNLSLPATVLYQLAARLDDPSLPIIIEELAKRATEARLKTYVARNIIFDVDLKLKAERKGSVCDSDAGNHDRDSNSERGTVEKDPGTALCHAMRKDDQRSEQSETIEPKPESPSALMKAWANATPDERREFLDTIGVDAIREAMSGDFGRELRARVPVPTITAQKKKRKAAMAMRLPPPLPDLPLVVDSEPAVPADPKTLN